MSNLNHGTVRLAADPRVFTNANGSKSVHFTLYVDRPYRDSEGNRPSDRIQLETYVRPETDVAKTPFGDTHQGDLVSLGFEVRSSVYADKETGEVRYAQVLSIVEASLLEGAATTSARLAKRVAALQGAAQSSESDASEPRPPSAARRARRPQWAPEGSRLRARRAPEWTVARCPRGLRTRDPTARGLSRPAVQPIVLVRGSPRCCHVSRSIGRPLTGTQNPVAPPSAAGFCSPHGRR